MKKKILAIMLGLILCLGMTGCASCENENYYEDSNLIPIEDNLYYYSTTHIVYIVFCKSTASQLGYGYMSPYYSENGKLYTYDTDTKQIVEIGE